jgi:hypothetical protein
MLLCRRVFLHVSWRSHCFRLQYKAGQEERYVTYNLVILNFSGNAGLCTTTPLPLRNVGNYTPLDKRVTSQKIRILQLESKVMFLFTTVWRFHPCHMAVTRPVVPSKVWPITLPCYSHHDNFKSNLKSFPRKWSVIAVGSPCVNILSIYAMCLFFNLMDNFRHETWQQDEVVPLSCYRNGSNYNSLYASAWAG